MADPLRIYERKAFEHWLVAEGMAESKQRLKELWDGLGYDATDVDNMWMGWKARAEFDSSRRR